MQTALGTCNTVIRPAPALRLIPDLQHMVSQPFIRENFLPYAWNLDFRSEDSIDLVVIHCTELPDLKSAREYGERIEYQKSETGNSGHFYVERSGRIEQWVPCSRVAHHVRGFNERSIGIELDNRGRYPDWFDSRSQEMRQDYSARQVENLIALLQFLVGSLKALKWIAGHEELDVSVVPAADNPGIDVRRKRDPGPRFPWSEVLRSIELEKLKSSID